MSNFGANEDRCVVTTLSDPFSANSWKGTRLTLSSTTLISQVHTESDFSVRALPVHDDLSLKILVGSFYASHLTWIVRLFHSTCLFSRLNLVNKLLLRQNRHEGVFHTQPFSGSFKKINAECSCSDPVKRRLCECPSHKGLISLLIHQARILLAFQ